MKALFAITLLLLAPIAEAGATEIEWFNLNQGTVAWDASQGLADGSPLPETDQIKYKLYLREKGTTEAIEQTTSPISELLFTLTISGEGSYLAGVRAVRVRGDQELGQSVIVWSDEPEYVSEGKPWGFISFIPPALPNGLRRVSSAFKGAWSYLVS